MLSWPVGEHRLLFFPQIRRGLRSECAWISVCVYERDRRWRERETEELRPGSGALAAAQTHSSRC